MAYLRPGMSTGKCFIGSKSRFPYLPSGFKLSSETYSCLALFFVFDDDAIVESVVRVEIVDAEEDYIVVIAWLVV